MINLGRVLWVTAVVAYPLIQLWVVAAWPVDYSLWHHAISDLGYTRCGREQRPGGMLETCSPRHRTYNFATIAVSLAILVGAWLMRSWWQRGRLMPWILAAFTLLTAGGLGASLVPGDVDLGLHALFALPLIGGQILVLVLVAINLRRTDRLVARAAAVVAAVSVIGTVLLGVALTGALPVGLTERLSAETFYLWILLAALVGPRATRRDRLPHRAGLRRE